jgi:ribokinase
VETARGKIMAIYNLGSINIDHVYRVPHLPGPGETLAAHGHATGLGGKGANQSVAAALAGAVVHHVGAVGAGADWALAAMQARGVDVCHVVRVAEATGHAIIYVDDAGENAIVIHPGANQAQSAPAIAAALAGAGAGDTLLLQNETSHQAEAAALARERGLRVVYSAAPFDVGAVRAVLPHVTVLVVNAVEAAQLEAAFGVPVGDLPVAAVVVTRGAAGAEWIARGAGPLAVPAFPADPVDTTGAGDCFAGSLAAMLDAGKTPEEAMRYAAAAAAIQVTRSGASDAMPSRAEVAVLLG